MIKVIHGNIFASNCKYLVNAVNCVGFMGKGIALEFSLRYPDMEQKYKSICAKKLLDIGKLWIYDAPDGKSILNFPTKYDYKLPSKKEYLEKGLQKFADTYKEKGIESIAFPLLGAKNGKISPELALEIMHRYLDKLEDVTIEIYINDNNASERDDTFRAFLNHLENAKDKKQQRLYDEVNNKKIHNFTTITETKINDLKEDGSNKRRTLASKKYIQKIMLAINPQINTERQTQLSLF
ncbi:macro domain-containing protein [Candidatus Saccharibacteria bacterium]|nr:macro domain-containing protein [Candidatus Saccharibacteria bacterium]